MVRYLASCIGDGSWKRLSRLSVWTFTRTASRSRWRTAVWPAKFGIWGLTQATALEGRDHGIVVSCLHPGNVLVERRQESGKTSDDEPMMTVDEISSAALHMLSMPPHVNFLEGIVLPTQQLYLGRG